MAPSVCFVSEEAIDALLQEHARAILSESAVEEVETQFQSLEQKLHALESQLMILKVAKKVTREGDFHPWPPALGFQSWGQDPIGNFGIYNNSIGVGYYVPGPLDHNWSLSEFKNMSAYEQSFAGTFQPPDPLDRTRSGVETTTAGGRSHGVVSFPQALEVFAWCRNTIERIATSDQIQHAFMIEDQDFGPLQSPFEMERITLSNQLRRRILTLDKQLAALKQQQNAHLPIARLPLEILIQLFDFVLSAEPHERRDETFILCTVLIRVCRVWTRIIQNTPSLWNHISPYSSSLKEVKMALDKSKPLPLSLQFNNAQMRRISFDSFLSAITKHVNRWRALDLHLGGWEIPRLLGKHLRKVFPPCLRRLRISAKHGGSIYLRSRISLFGGRFPNSLKHFGLIGCGMDPSQYAKLRGLATLELSPNQKTSVAEILRLVSNYPELEDLILGGRVVSDEQPVSGTALLNTGSSVRLDRLRGISISLEPAPMNALLRDLQAPNCTKFCIEAIQPSRTESAWTESLFTDRIRSFIRVLESVLCKASAISIKVYNGLLELTTDPPDSDFTVSLKFGATRLAEVGRWMANSLTLGPAPVTLYFATSEAAWMEALPSILSNFNNIVKLTFVGLDTTYQQAIDFLGTPVHTETTNHHHFPAPRLACMDVMAEYIPNIIHMVEQRQSAEVANAGHPVKLSRLTLRRDLCLGFTEDEITGRLCSALAGGEVEWLII